MKKDIITVVWRGGTVEKWSPQQKNLGAFDTKAIFSISFSLCVCVWPFLTHFWVDSFVTLKTSTTAKDEVSGRTLRFLFLCYVALCLEFRIHNWDERCFLYSFLPSVFSPSIFISFLLSHALRLQTSLRRVTALSYKQTVYSVRHVAVCLNTPLYGPRDVTYYWKLFYLTIYIKCIFSV